MRDADKSDEEEKVRGAMFTKTRRMKILRQVLDE